MIATSGRESSYPALRRAGLRRIRVHDLRHGAASMLTRPALTSPRSRGRVAMPMWTSRWPSTRTGSPAGPRPASERDL